MDLAEMMYRTFGWHWVTFFLSLYFRPANETMYVFSLILHSCNVKPSQPPKQAQKPKLSCARLYYTQLLTVSPGLFTISTSQRGHVGAEIAKFCSVRALERAEIGSTALIKQHHYLDSVLMNSVRVNLSFINSSNHLISGVITEHGGGPRPT